MIPVLRETRSGAFRRRRADRRGSIYIITLTTTMLVAALGIAALSTARIQRRQLMESEESRQAQLHAMSALQLARYRIQNDPLWRSRLNSNLWSTNQAIGAGFYSFTGVDPIDGNLTNGDFDQVVIIAKGKQGDCEHSISAQFEFVQPGVSGLMSAIHAETDLEISNVTLTGSNGEFGSNAKTKVKSSAAVYGNCIANNVVEVSGGGQVFGTSKNGVAKRVLPNSTVISDYQLLGTTILATSLPLWDREYIDNPGAESGVPTPWVPVNCNVTVSTAQAKSGSRSFYISNRTLLADGTIKLDITSKVAQNVRYNITANVLDPNLLGLDSYRLHLRVQTTNGTTSFTSPWGPGNYNTWSSLAFTPTLTWTGTLIKAELYIQTSLGLGNFYIDDFSMKEADAESNTYVIHRALLSPQNNPFTGVLNTQGIYVLQCNSNRINIRDSRINGTLVIIDPDPASRIERSINWEPTVYFSSDPDTPNLPALLANDKLFIGTNSTVLDEALCNVNFNPNGSPYNSVADSDSTDTYASYIAGIVYAAKDLTISRYTTIKGSVLCNEKIFVQDASPAGSSVNITCEPLYYYLNPPLGFRDVPILKLVPESVEQLVQ